MPYLLDNNQNLYFSLTIVFDIIIDDRFLDSNQLSGTIPSFLGDLSSLGYLYVSDRNVLLISIISFIWHLLIRALFDIIIGCNAWIETWATMN